MRVEVVHVAVLPLILAFFIAVNPHRQVAVASTTDDCEGKLVESRAANEGKVAELVKMGKELELLRQELRDMRDEFAALKSASTQTITNLGMDLLYDKSYVRTRCACACVVGLAL